ncbi:ATP-binding protein, partial [Frankia sp. CiP3]|uniref:ATP-binding protein n=1 Tax=Frankia sp. CiP3 TaxID=2880971 RepID=UPI001EF49827
MGRRFNTAGPCRPGIDYMIPAVSRLPDAPTLIDQDGYFVVHAPRQTGKTTTLQALADELTAAGRYAALLVSCETGRAWGDDIGAASRAILDQIRAAADDTLPADLRPPAWPVVSDGTLLAAGLRAWAQGCPRPLVLFIDEIDALRGQTLVSVLSQLRDGYRRRPHDFPASVALCGLRDVRDYQVAAGSDPSRLGTSSPFNIKVESLRLGDLTPDEVRALYGQHAANTGQTFTPDAVQRAITLTAGQPWLVNALAREIVEKIAVPVPEPITAEHVEQAKERLILARATHLDSLAARLAEPRVQKILGPVLTGDVLTIEPYDDDLTYLRDLGLIAPTPPVRIANPIYREVVVRVLSSSVQESVTADPRSFIRSDGTFDLDRMLVEFTEFWIEHGEFLVSGGSYGEAAPQLILMGFLQRVVNGGGYVDREYGVGTGRVDLLVRWPHTGDDGIRRLQREALELKVWRAGRPDPLRAGLTQLDRYLDRLALGTGVLVIFDQRPTAADIAERTTITR